MANSVDNECSGCKISMFCRRKKEDGQPCETSLKAVAVAFLIPLCCVVAVLALAQGRVGEGWTVVAVFAVLLVYFLLVWLIKPDFRKKD